MSLGLRPQELKKEAKSHKALLDSLNEVSTALLELVPWRAREGLERTVAEDNDRFRLVSDAVAQRVEAIDAALLRAQQVGGHAPPGTSPPRGLPTHCSLFQSHRRGREGQRARAGVCAPGGARLCIAGSRLPSGLRPGPPVGQWKEQPRSPAPRTEGLLSPHVQAVHVDFRSWLGQICVCVIIIILLIFLSYHVSHY